MIAILTNELYEKNADIKNIKYLISIKIINIHVESEYTFRWACEKGYLSLAKWLWEVSCKSIDIHIYDEYAFRWACEGGYLEVIEWLWSLDGKINIHVNDECAFRWACSNGHLEVVKWLWKVSLKSIDIHAKHDFVFDTGQENILEWLKSLK